MTIQQLLTEAADRIAASPVLALVYAHETPFLDAVLLFGKVVGWSKARVMSGFHEEAPASAIEPFRAAVDDRSSGVPVAYILGRKDFYDLTFAVDKRVLSPRPETETLVEASLEILRVNPGFKTVHDACTGSGCIAITLAHQLPMLSISASDISDGSAAVFNKNSMDILGKTLPFYQSDLLENVPGTFDMIVSNPPYLSDADAERLRTSGWKEPYIAFAGGPEGTELPERLIRASIDRLTPGGYGLFEAADAQMDYLSTVMHEAGFSSVELRKDLAGKSRCLIGIKAGNHEPVH